MSGTHVIPVRSFTWGIKVPHNVATGQASGQPRYQWLEVIKPIDASSPVLFRMLVNNENLTSAKLELQTPAGGDVFTTYATYTFTNASVAGWDDTTSETVKLSFESAITELAKTARPAASMNQVIGQMTVPSISSKPVPIVGFATGVSSPRDPASGQASGKRQHKPVVVRRAIDALTAEVLTKAAQNGQLGSITIELRRLNPQTGVVETYGKYTYSNAVPVAVEDSGASVAAASGGFATQELQFTYSKVEVEVEKTLGTDDWTLPQA